jgi:hypothetical protein
MGVPEATGEVVTEPRDGPSRPGGERILGAATWTGIVVLGLAVGLGVLIQSLKGQPSAPEDVPRALAIPALYATAAGLAILSARQRRPWILAAAGILCLAGTALSIATIAFAVPGLLLVLLATRLPAHDGAVLAEVAVGAVVVALVLGAAAALLGTTEGRCWNATGTPGSPRVEVIPCSADGSSSVVGGEDAFASGFDSAVITWRGAVLEAALLIGAVGLVWLTGRGDPGPRRGEAAGRQS